MRNSLSKQIMLAALLATMGGLTACGNVSRNVAPDGSHADTLEWPSPDSTISIHKGGTFPNPADIRLINGGMNKRQVTDRIGAPHFNEGIWGVREWNYLFNFRKHGSDQVTRCQYKILFDDNKLARSFYWKPASCAEFVNPPKRERKRHESIAGQTLTLPSDALFTFNKSDAANITPHGREELAALAKKIGDAGDKVSAVEVVGYTDRLGSHAYNQDLSQRRADTVRNYLQQQGVPANKLTAQGRGESNPITACGDGKRATLIACLAPNRRVEVTVQGAE